MRTIRSELDAIRAELARLRQERDGAAAAAEPGAPEHMAELGRLVQQMIDSAEDTVSEHPAAAIAGALALGIIIGRMTAR